MTKLKMAFVMSLMKLQITIFSNMDNSDSKMLCKFYKFNSLSKWIN